MNLKLGLCVKVENFSFKFCTICGSFFTHFLPLFYIIKFYSQGIKLSKKLFVFIGVL